MLIVGIDPGQKGGIAVHTGQPGPFAIPMPLAGKDVDVREVLRFIEDFDNPPWRVVVEKVHSMPKQGVSSTFKFGVNYGRLLGAIEGRSWPLTLVTPQAWKKIVLAGTDKSKDAAIEFVHRRYPSLDLSPGRLRVPHDGIADAMCLAEYGRVTL